MEEEFRTVQWAPDGNPLNGSPVPVLFLLSDDGTHYGYGPGPGWSMMFGTRDHGDIKVEPKQWVTRYADGMVTVTDERPTQ